MKRKLYIGSTAVFIALALAFSAGAVRAGGKANQGKGRELVMSFNEYLTSNTTLDGDVTLTGAVSDRGTRHEDFVVTGSNADGSEVYIAGTATITASQGTITMKFAGTIFFDTATFDQTLLAYVKGPETITGGTGAYVGVKGRGIFAASLDYTNNNVVGVFDARM